MASKSRKKSPLHDGKKSKSKDDRESLAYKVLPVEKTKELAELDCAEEMQKKMAEIMQLTDYEVDLKEASLLDCYVSAFWWGKEQNFSLEQLSAFFTLQHTLLENIREKGLNLAENVCEFKKMLAGIGESGDGESGGLECFDVAQAKDITEYLHTSLYQHYKMYEFLFTHTRAEEIIGTDLSVEVANAADMPWPPPLDEGVSEEIYMQYIATPPPSPAPQEEVSEGADGQMVKEDREQIPEVSEKEADLLAQLSPEEVQRIIRSVLDEVLGGLQDEVAQKLREQENTFISRINKVHRIAST